jgi:hypothetical protein
MKYFRFCCGHATNLFKDFIPSRSRSFLSRFRCFKKKAHKFWIKIVLLKTINSSSCRLPLKPNKQFFCILTQGKLFFQLQVIWSELSEDEIQKICGLWRLQVKNQVILLLQVQYCHKERSLHSSGIISKYKSTLLRKGRQTSSY